VGTDEGKPRAGLTLRPSRAPFFMNKKMKILIAYDGSESADDALSDLPRAGLPGDVEALVYVADVWLPSSQIEFARATEARRLLAADASSFAPASRAVEEERALSRAAARRLSSLFPAWEVSAEFSPELGMPATELIRKAISWRADLIVLGSRRGTELYGSGRGHAARKVVAEAPCAVRVSRPAPRTAAAPVRLILSVDGSPGSEQAVAAIATREWPEGSECRLVTSPASAGPSIRRAAEALRAAGLNASTVVRGGDTGRILLEAAREWEADCIFVGSDGKSDSRGPGPTVTSLAESAPCSVEVARKRIPWAATGVFLPLAHTPVSPGQPVPVERLP